MSLLITYFFCIYFDVSSLEEIPSVQVIIAVLEILLRLSCMFFISCFVKIIAEANELRKAATLNEGAKVCGAF